MHRLVRIGESTCERAIFSLPPCGRCPGKWNCVSHKLLLRGGYIRQLAAGIYSLLPLGLRVIRRSRQIVREEMDAAGAQEVLLPALHPLELWEKSGRADYWGDELMRLKDRGGRCLRAGRHARRGHHRPGRRLRALLSRTALHALSDSDEVPRRPSAAGRPDPRARVRDEGRLQLRPRHRRASTLL